MAFTVILEGKILGEGKVKNYMGIQHQGINRGEL